MEPLAKTTVGPFISALLKIRHFGSLHGLQTVLVVEGILMFGVSILGLMSISHGPGRARWLHLAEKDMIVAGLKCERIGQTALLDAMSKLKLVRGLLSPVTLIMSLMLLLNGITTNGLAALQSSIVTAAYPNSSETVQQCLSIPVYLVSAFLLPILPATSRAESWVGRSYHVDCDILLQPPIRPAEHISHRHCPNFSAG